MQISQIWNTAGIVFKGIQIAINNAGSHNTDLSRPFQINKADGNEKRFAITMLGHIDQRTTPTGAPSVTDFPIAGTWGISRRNDTGVIQLCYNDSGTLRTVTLS